MCDNSLMKLINQNDYPDVEYLVNLKDDSLDHRSNIKDSGCGICCAMMIVNHYYPEINITMLEAIKVAYEANATYSQGTNFYRYSTVFCEKYNLKYTNTEDINELINHVNDEKVALVNVGGDHDDHIGVLSHNGHYILVTGYINNKLQILDPGLEPNKYLEKDRIDKVIVDGEYIYIDPKILIDDIQNRLPHPIFLFDKKD